ncbi:MAG TPA: ABC transporter permease [Polyangiaceae bacterium]|nr:ABC transporter permease [Polyangiaceae bacterium]
MSAPLAADATRTSYYTLVARELEKNRLAMLGLKAVVGLVALAIGAPLIASNQPFVLHDASGWWSPWLRGLFDRLVFESAVDVFFNLLLVLAPFVALGIWSLGRVKPPRVALRGRFLRGMGLAFVVLFALLAPERIGSLNNPLHYSHQVQNYRLVVAEARTAGQPMFAIFPPHPFSYKETDPTRSLRAPGTEHWLGTDTEGRDVFARMLYGTRISLSIGIVAVGLYVLIGIVVGALAGYFGGWVDSALSRLIEVMICFPTFFLILTLAALIRERSIFHVMFIIGITSWTGVARLVRAEFLKHKGLEYVQAARALGVPVRRIIFGHILPNASAPVLVSATFGIASAILVESSLAFLGIGDPTVASWGETLNDGRIEQRLWLILGPGLAIFFVVTVFNLVGEGLRDALDPKLRR